MKDSIGNTLHVGDYVQLTLPTGFPIRGIVKDIQSEGGISLIGGRKRTAPNDPVVSPMRLVFQPQEIDIEADPRQGAFSNLLRVVNPAAEKSEGAS